MKKLISLFCLLLCLTTALPVTAEDTVVTLDEITSEGTYVAHITRKIKFKGEGLLDHYYIQQGSATDGVYGYFLVESRFDGGCGMWKIDLDTWEILDITYNLPVEHGNGMAYNGKLNQFIVAHCKPTQNRLSFIDRDTMEVVRVLDMPFNVMSVAYDETSDRYVMGHKDARHFSICDADFNVLATHRIPDGFCNNQDADCDENYIYMLEWDTDKLYASNISVFDWEGHFINSIRIKSMNEVESMFHLGDRVILPFYTQAADIYEAEIVKTVK